MLFIIDENGSNIDSTNKLKYVAAHLITFRVRTREIMIITPTYQSYEKDNESKDSQILEGECPFLCVVNF